MRSLRIIEIENDSSNQIFSRGVYDRSNVFHSGLDVDFIALPTSSLQQLIKAGVRCQDKFIHAQSGSGWDDRLCPAHKHLAPNGSDLKRAHHQETKECYGNTHQVQRHCPSISINVHARLRIRSQSIVYDPLFSNILGPLDTCSIWPSGETQIADTVGMPLTKALPLSGPSSSKVVESASDAVAVLATTLTA